MEKRIVKRYEYELLENTFHNDYLDVFIARRKDRHYSFREYRSADLYRDELAKYKKIQKIGVNVQKLIAHDKRALILIFERFHEPSALEILSKQELPELYYKLLFTIYRLCRFAKVEINYLPENFILKGTTLYYIGEEIFEPDPRHNLENFGLRYWMYSKEATTLLSKKGYSINPKRLISDEEANKRIVLLSVIHW